MPKILNPFFSPWLRLSKFHKELVQTNVDDLVHQSSHQDFENQADGHKDIWLNKNTRFLT
jgi:hypothetical protein